MDMGILNTALSESVAWADSMGYAFKGSGFTQVPGGESHASTSVYAYHYYYPLPNPSNVDGYLDQREKDAADLKAASFVTEFNLDATSSKTMDALDERLISWTGKTILLQYMVCVCVNLFIVQLGNISHMLELYRKSPLL